MQHGGARHFIRQAQILETGFTCIAPWLECKCLAPVPFEGLLEDDKLYGDWKTAEMKSIKEKLHLSSQKDGAGSRPDNGKLQSHFILLLGGLIFCGLWLVSCTPAPAPAPQTNHSTPGSQASAPGRRTPTPSPVAPTPQPTSAIQVTPQDLRGLQLTFWHPWSGGAASALAELVGEFNAQNEWGIQVNSIYQGNFDDLYNQVITATHSASAPE